MADLSAPLSANFTLKELLRSATAERDPALKKEQQNPPENVLTNLKYVAKTVLQPIRTQLDYPIKVTSGYRSPGLNKAVKGSSTSQHVIGEAVDIQLSDNFLTAPAAAKARGLIQEGVKAAVGKPIRADVAANFYLFAFICLNLDDLDVDQLIHEYGDDYGQPAWVHVSASSRQNKRQILFVGQYTKKEYLSMSVKEALAKGT